MWHIIETVDGVIACSLANRVYADGLFVSLVKGMRWDLEVWG